MRQFHRSESTFRYRTHLTPPRPPFFFALFVFLTPVNRVLYKKCGQEGKPATFILTEAEMKDETFLEIMNSFLMTGEVPNLFPKVTWANKPLRASKHFVSCYSESNV